MRTMSTSPVGQASLTSWGKATVALLFTNAVVMAVLVLHLVQSGEAIEPAVPIAGLLVLAAAAALAVTRNRWICLAGGAVLAIALVGGLPHHLDALAGRSGTGALLFAVVAVAAEGVGIIVAMTALVRGARSES